MNAKTVTILIAIAGALATAAATDLDAFQKARAADPNAKFDWPLFSARMARAALICVPTALGASVTLGAS